MSGSPKQTDLWDAIIVGGGPAGLNAALVLGRCRRKVLLFDDGRPRNAVSHALHGFLSRDGVAPGAIACHCERAARGVRIGRCRRSACR